MIWDAVLAGLAMLLHWETYVAGLEYVLIFFGPVLLLTRRDAPAEGYGKGCLFMIVIALVYVMAVAVFTLTLSPLILGLGDHAAWGFPWIIMSDAPDDAIKLLGSMLLAGFAVSFIPVLGEIFAFHVLVLGGIAIAFVAKMIHAVHPDGSAIEMEYVPSFGFLLVLLVIGGAMSFLGSVIAASIQMRLSRAGAESGTLWALPIASVFGFVPVFMYGAWLGAQLRW